MGRSFLKITLPKVLNWIDALINFSRNKTSLTHHSGSMMTSSNGNIFRVTGPLCGEFTGHRWIPLTMASNAELWCFLWSAPWVNDWVKNREAGDLRSSLWRHFNAKMINIVLRWMLFWGVEKDRQADMSIKKINDKTNHIAKNKVSSIDLMLHCSIALRINKFGHLYMTSSVCRLASFVT